MPARWRFPTLCVCVSVCVALLTLLNVCLCACGRYQKQIDAMYAEIRAEEEAAKRAV